MAKTILEHDRCILIQGDAAELDQVLAENSIDAIISDPPAGIGFMANDWDKNKGGRDGWVAWLTKTIAAAFRALKPGGYGLIWALPRTSHWTAWALEDAGFEIRDVHHHLFGSGMPKSLDLCREVDMHLCELAGRHYDKHLPPEKKRRDGDHLCPEHPAREQVAGIRRTSLKPAVEHWILVRKPLEGTYAENALKFGTGGMNVEACRIEGRDRTNYGLANATRTQGSTYGTPTASADFDASVGRWPAHVSLDAYAAFLLDEQSGTLTSGSRQAGVRKGMGYGGTSTGDGGPPISSSSGASRFFYVAKPTRSEKERGLDHLEAKSGGEATGREDDSIGTQNPRAGAGRTGGAKNIHPTVKSEELMRWLITLITPPGGIVLDPFAGSGSTGVAALNAGFDFVGCELGGDDGEYLPILLGRIEHALVVDP